VLPHTAAIGGGDAGTFLPAVLKGKKAEVGNSRRIFAPVNGKNATFIPRAVFHFFFVLIFHRDFT
jgi:hypothetical protein